MHPAPADAEAILAAGAARLDVGDLIEVATRTVHREILCGPISSRLVNSGGSQLTLTIPTPSLSSIFVPKSSECARVLSSSWSTSVLSSSGHSGSPLLNLGPSETSSG